MSSLEAITTKLGKNAAALLKSAIVADALQEKEHLIVTRHAQLTQLAKGTLYHSLATSMIEELESKLKFLGEIPFPNICSKTGMRHQDYAFIDGEPVLGMAFPERGLGTEIRMEIGCGPYVNAQLAALSTRIHVNLMPVENYEQFQAFLKKSLKSFREANPLIPLTTAPNEGDLVYCIRYARHPKSSHPMPAFGNVLAPNERLAVVERINGTDYVLKRLDNQIRTKRNFNNHTDNEETIDDILLVKPKGFAKDELDIPFMTDKEAEAIIWPIWFKYASDPRINITHELQSQLLIEQLHDLVSEGMNGHTLTDIFTKDYGLTFEQFFELAGGAKMDLGLLVRPALEQLMKTADRYGSYVREMFSGAAKILEMTEEQLFAPAELPAKPDEESMFERYFHRKIRANDYRGNTYVGYVSDIHDLRRYHEEGFNANLFTDMQNPLKEDSVSLNKVEILGLEEYKKPVSVFEIETIATFITTQLDRIGRNNPNLEARTEEASELIGDILEKLGEDEAKKKEHRNVNSKTYDQIMAEFDEHVVGPLLSVGWNEEQVRSYVTEVTGGHPLFNQSMNDIFNWRNRKTNNPFTRSPLARKLLAAVTKDGSRGYEHIIRRIEEFRVKYGESAEAEDLMNAGNIILGTHLAEQHGEHITPLAELLEEQSTGHKRQYLDSHTLGCIINEFMLAGAPTQKAIESAYKRDRGEMLGRILIQETAGGSLLEMKITNRDVDRNVCAILVLDEIAMANADDPRNKEYLAHAKRVGYKERLKASTGRVYVMPESNYYVSILPDSSDYHDRTTYIAFGNNQYDQLHYDTLPDLAAEIKALREAGMPIKIDGKHKIEPDPKGGFNLIPEWELDLQQNGPSNLVFVSEDRALHRPECGDIPNEYKIDPRGYNSDIVVRCSCDYFGRERFRSILTKAGQKIDTLYKFKQQGMIDYANYLQQLALRPVKPMAELTE